ncbi:MAG: C13 family peptidase, partial [bacterium]
MKICFAIRARGILPLLFSIFCTLLFLSFLFSPLYVTANQDMVNLGLVGQWNDYGDFRAMEIWTREETGPEGKQLVTYAGCATSRGLAIFDVNSQSISSFIPLCECNDLKIVASNDGDVTLAYLACGEKGLYIFNVDNPKVPYYVSLCETPGRAKGLAIEEAYAYVADGESGLQIIDMTHKNRPVIIGSCDTQEYAESVAITDHYALIADGDGGLSIIDITHMQMPEIIGWCELSGYACDVATMDAYAYVASKEYGLQVIDIYNKSEPQIAGHSHTPGSALGVTLAGSFAYVADEESGLQIIDITEKGNPLAIGGFMTPGGASDVSIAGNYAYIAGFNGSLQTVDITTKTGPRVIGGCEILEEAVDAFIAGDFAYVADRKKGIQIFDISDTNTPVPAGSFDIKNGAYGVCVVDNCAYVACRGGTLQIIDISDKDAPGIVKICSTGLYSRQVFIDGNYAYVAVGNEQSFDINDLFNGLRIVDIHDPNNAHIVGSLFTPGTAFDVVTEEDYAFIADGVNGLQIINITDKSNPVFAGNCKIPGSAVALARSGDYAYIAYWGAGFYIMDITNKNNPIIVGSYDFHGHATDVFVAGEYAFVTDADGGLRIFDISDKNEPVHLGNCGTPGSAQAIAIAGNHAFVADYNAGLQIIDIANKAGPELVKKISHFYYASDVAVLGNYVYVADPGTGLRIIDITQENGPVTVGSYATPGYAEGLAVTGNYAYIADWDGGLQIIDITIKNKPAFAGSCVLPGYAEDVAVDGNYAYITDGDFHIINISNKQDPQIVGKCDILMARYVVVAGDYAYVASTYTEGYDKISSLRIIDISDKNNPQIMGTCDAPVYIKDMIIENDYIYLADGNGGFQIVDIRDKTHPSPLGSCSTPGYAEGIAIAGSHAYISDWGSGVQIIDISDPNTPKIVGSHNTPGTARDIAIAGEYVYVADWENGMLKIKIDTDFSSKGNLILMAGGGADQERALWPATRAQTNHVFQTFINQGYESYDIWYINPVSFNDPDNDGIFNQLVVDDPTPTKAEFLDSIAKWAMESPNQGPLYICLIGHGAEDRFQIMPNEVLSAWELKEHIDRFQNGYVDNKGKVYEGTHRPVVVIIESAASGTFIDDLLSDGITVITSTREGPSYIKPDLFDSDALYSAPTPPGDQIRAFKSFTTALTHTIEPYLAPGAISDEMYLRDAFIGARDVMQSWILDGLPFSNQVPQMAVSGSDIISLDFSENGDTPLEHLMMDQNSIHLLTILMKDSNYIYAPFPFQISFFSSDPNIIAPEEIDMTFDPNGIPWYEIKAKRNGNLTLTGFLDPQVLSIFLSAAINIDVALDDPAYRSSKGKKAVIVAGYKGTGDYLWESTNAIANHAYQTIRAMGYAKDDIFYYNPYLLQDLDGIGGYDEIRGYPLLNALNPDSPYSAFSDIKQNGARELFLFFVDHGNKGSFCMNPSETLTCCQLTEWIAAIANHVEERIVLLYDACYSGSFLQEMEEDPGYTDALAEKLLMITSTDPNQTAYYLNQGMVSFSYPFLDEWYLTHSIMDAFDYATHFLPHEGQTPLTSDPNIIISWDQERIYYVDESRPVIFDPNVSRNQGILRISAQAYSLTGISEVWAIVEVSHVQKDGGGRPVTDIPVISLGLDSDPNFPYGGSYSVSIDDPYPHEPRYNLILYAQDSSKRPKVTSHKIAIGHKSEHKTVALILSSAPDLIPEYEREVLTTQLERAEAILKSKGLTEGEIKKVNSLADLEVPSLIEGQTLLVYILGLIRHTDEGPLFFFNPYESISPEALEDILDPNHRHFILVEAPYAVSFLSRINWQGKKNWAGAASTHKESLFFSIGKDATGSDYSPFPCFSNFF